MDKPEVGQVVYSLNVGNAARGREQELTPMEVIKVGKKYFTCVSSEWSREIKFHLDTWKEKTEYSSNHKLYDSPEKWEIEREKLELLKALRDYFGIWGKVDLDLDQLREIYAIVSKGT
jgi:hypothetical protein